MTRTRFVGAGFAALLLLALSPPSAAGTSGVAYEFNVDGDREGWGQRYNVSPLIVSGGSLHCTVIGEDPQFTSPVVYVDAAENPLILIRMKVEASGWCQIYWDTLTESVMDEQKVRVFQTGDAGEWQLYALNMSGHPKWVGDIREIRIDPPDWAGQVEVDYVHICSKANLPAELSIVFFPATGQAVLTTDHPFKVTAKLMNSGAQPALNIRASLTVPVGMELQGPADKILPDLAGGTSIDLEWTVSSVDEVAGSILLSVTADGQEPLSSQYYAHVRLKGSAVSTLSHSEIVMCHLEPWVLQDISQWEYVWHNIDVLKFYVDEVNSASVSDLRKMVEVLNRHDIKIAIEVAGLHDSYADKGNQTAEYTVRDEMGKVKKLTDPISEGGAGGVITYLDFDGAILRMLSPAEGMHTSHTIETATDEYVKAVRLWKQAYPGIKIMEITNFPNWGWKGAAAYWNYFKGQESNTYDDYFIVLQEIIQKTETAGLSIDGLTVDNPYDFVTGSYRSNQPNTLNKVDWFARLKDLVEYAQSQTLQVNIIFNCESSGDQSTRSAHRYFLDTIAYINEYHRLIGVPSRYVIQSWYYYPDLIVPETTPYTMTYLVSEVIKNVHEYTNYTKENSTLSCECPEKIASGGSINISCMLNPIHEDTTIIFTMTDPSGKSDVANISTGINGSASYTFKPGMVGVWRVEARWLGDSAHSASEAIASFTVIAPPRPATINVKSLVIPKTSVKSGEEVTVNATLENTGELSGNYTLVFSLDGVEKNSSFLTLDGGKTVTRTMKFSSSVEGTHTVTVGSKSVTFEVEKASVAQTGIDGYPFESVFIGLMLVVLILVVYRKSQNTCR